MNEIIDLAVADPDEALRWAEYVASNLRSSERAAMAAFHSLSPMAALRTALSVSTHAWAVLRDHGPVAIIGAMPTPHPLTGLVWLLSTEGADSGTIASLMDSDRRLSDLKECYGALVAFTSPEGVGPLLEHLGFGEVATLADIGREGRTIQMHVRPLLV